MSHSSKIFEEAPIKVQNKNGFDLSHLTSGTAKCGQLVPVLCKLLPPNTDFTLGCSMQVELPPLATSFFGRVDAIIEGFVVPCSILYGGWKQFISNQPFGMFPYSQSTIEQHFALPYFDLQELASATSASEYIQLLATNDNIAEYLGIRELDLGPDDPQWDGFYINLLPFLAYHLIWDTYYRNKNVTRTIFAVNPNVNTSTVNAKNISLVWHSFYTRNASTGKTSGAEFTDNEMVFPDGISVFSTRQRNYSRDYFTAAMPNNVSDQASVEINNSEFTISALRSANSLAKFLETNNLSNDYSDMMRNRWGTRPIDADFDEPYYLGRVVVPVYQKSVYMSNESAVKATGGNPFVKAGTLGSKGASGNFVGSGSICSKYHNTTWSYVYGLFSLVPHAMIGQGINRELTYLNIGDFPAPELQSVGYDNIKCWELYADEEEDPELDFGYIPRYSRFKYIDDSVHGELRQGKSLDSFVLQRVFSAVPEISTSFLEIPQNALDDVLAISTSTMKLTCWYEIFWEFKASMPLSTFCVPTLGELPDSHYQNVPIGGSRL